MTIAASGMFKVDNSLLICGMHGLGDNLHQRAVVRQFMRQGFDVWLESSWVAPYHDLISHGLKIIRKSTPLRTQSKNAAREAYLFHDERPPRTVRQIHNHYSLGDVRSYGSVLAAMLSACRCDIRDTDFRLPIPDAWNVKVDRLIEKWKPTKPLLVYRPLVLRTEWGGCAARNPKTEHYERLFNLIRDRFFVVGVADLVPDVEWIVGNDVPVDARCYAGELEFETLAALTARAELVFCSPGFATILAQAVSTPVITIFGGFETSASYSAGAKFSPYLGIDTTTPCLCFQHNHSCGKEIPASADKRILDFVNAVTNG